METKANLIKNILATELLAPSHGELAKALGYRGRMSLYRLSHGTASERAVDSFCSRLEEVFYIDDDILRKIATTIDDTANITRIVRRCSDSSQEDWPFGVLRAFVTNDYTMMSDGFAENELLDLLAIERADSDRFYAMLAYFYIRATHVNFYAKGMSHLQRCAAVMEALGKRFVEIFPENSIACSFVYIYSTTELLKFEAPILMSLVLSIGTMLSMFRNPEFTTKQECDALLLSGMRSRTYLECSDHEKLILMRMVSEIGSSGYYELFVLNRVRETVDNLYAVAFLTERVVLVRSKINDGRWLGRYVWDGTTLALEWENDGDNPIGLGNVWRKLALSDSRSLRELDRSITDDTLSRKVLQAEGWEEIPGFRVRDVVISCEVYSLVMQNGSRYSIPLGKARFLERVLPSEPVRVCRRSEDGIVFVFWPNIKHTLPIEAFDRN